MILIVLCCSWLIRSNSKYDNKHADANFKKNSIKSHILILAARYQILSLIIIYFYIYYLIFIYFIFLFNYSHNVLKWLSELTYLCPQRSVINWNNVTRGITIADINKSDIVICSIEQIGLFLEFISNDVSNDLEIVDRDFFSHCCGIVIDNRYLSILYLSVLYLSCI